MVGFPRITGIEMPAYHHTPLRGDKFNVRHHPVASRFHDYATIHPSRSDAMTVAVGFIPRITGFIPRNVRPVA
jgi:hypothetical protein